MGGSYVLPSLYDMGLLPPLEESKNLSGLSHVGILNNKVELIICCLFWAF